MEISAGSREDGDKTGITAIVIDDDIDTVSVLCEFLRIKGINVLGKGYDGAEAIKIYRKLEPDVVFLDVMMENPDGFYTLEKIREIQPDAIVILITADTTEETRKKLLKLDASAIIYKPYDIIEVVFETNRLVLRVKEKLLEEIAVKNARLQEINTILRNLLDRSKMNSIHNQQYFNEKEKLI
jgi:DNA-binding response OmpR family regulator